jgi:N-acetylneuraminic acid mutarotase
MRMMLVGIAALIVFGGARAKADFIYMQKADMPTGRWAQTSAVVNDKIYVFGGFTSQPDWIPLSTVEEYDPATDTWTRKADMLTVRCDMLGSSPVVDDKVYVIGGYSSGDSCGGTTVEEYDPVTDTWTRKADMPTRRWSLATCAVDGKIYAIGGAPSSCSPTGLNAVEEYDPVTDTWTRKANMPTGLWGLCAHVVNGKIYTFGGRPGLKAITRVQQYDPATDTWTRKTDMPIATSQMASVVLGDKIIVIGGWLWSMNYPYSTVQMYDTQTDTWTIEADAPFQRAVFSAEVVNNRIYVIGGTDRPHPCPALSTVFELTVNPPPPDFNGDGMIDSVDMCIMVDYWGTDYSLCDIAPPFGDGIVDVEDMKVLAEHLFEEVDDPTLIAHWAFDETEGILAHASAADYDGVLFGDPVWQPDGGMVDGALELDGIDDYVSTDPVLYQVVDKFSVVAWIKGGAPGQVVLSQMGKANWLGTDPSEGFLMTELTVSGRNSRSLGSEAVITDGNWHRIGFVWDGSYRRLYVDGVVVAEDAQDNLDISDNGLYFGTGKAMEPGTFFSGLIDDIRIYNRAIIP